MNKTAVECIHKVNYLSVEIESLYHQAALKIGLTDSAMLILYHLYDNGGSCLLSNIYKQSGTSRQTINSAVRKLEKDSILYLEQQSGKMKKLCLTEKGRAYVDETVTHVFRAEIDAYSTWSEEEIRLHLQLMEKYAASFRRQLENL